MVQLNECVLFVWLKKTWNSRIPRNSEKKESKTKEKKRKPLLGRELKAEKAKSEAILWVPAKIIISNIVVSLNVVFLFSYFILFSFLLLRLKPVRRTWKTLDILDILCCAHVCLLMLLLVNSFKLEVSSCWRSQHQHSRETFMVLELFSRWLCNSESHTDRSSG